MLILVVPVSCTLLSCGQPDEVSDETIPTFTLAVIDSLGVAYGDSTQMYGIISGALYMSPDRLVVLDKAMEVVWCYSDQDDVLASYSYHGSGPTEIMYGGYLSKSGDGVVIIDEWLPECVILDSNMTPVSKLSLDETMSLFEPSLLADTSLVGCIYSSRQNNDTAEFGVEVCRWAESGERMLEYYSEYYPMDGSVEELYSNYIKTEFSVAANSERVFIAPDRAGFMILSFDVDGIRCDTIDLAHQREERSELEKEIELAFRIDRDINVGSWEPSDLEPGITQLQVQDSLERLWVCHGAYLDPEFDILSFDGELLFTASCHGLPEYELVRFSITDYGYLAYTITPLEYPKVYILDLIEQQ